MISQKALLLRKTKSAVILAATGTVAFAGIGVWTGNERFFEDYISPVLTFVDPELSHKSSILLAKYHLQRKSLLEDNPKLKTGIGSLNFSNPIGIAAGFDKNAECMSGLQRIGYGWVEIGSATPLPQVGNSKPRVFRLPEDSAIINRYGFNNDGHERIFKRVQAFKRDHPDFVIGVNLGANKDSSDRISDYCVGIERFSDFADYFVINISSPNTPNLRDLQKSESLPELLKSVMRTRDKMPRRVPVFLKVAPDLNDSDITSICNTIIRKETKVDGLIISNTTIQRPSLESKLQTETGGLSGKPLERLSTILIAKFYATLKGQVPIIGVGGIWNGKDAFAKIQAGASVVQIYSVVAYKGLGVVASIKKELAEILEKNGYNSVADAVGTRHLESQKGEGPKRSTSFVSSGPS